MSGIVHLPVRTLTKDELSGMQDICLRLHTLLGAYKTLHKEGIDCTQVHLRIEDAVATLGGTLADTH